MNILKKDINFNLKRKQYLDEFITNEHFLALKNLDIVEKCDLIGFHGQQYTIIQSKQLLFNLAMQRNYQKC